MLRELVGMVVMQGNRDSPRNSDLRLESRSKLIQMRKELLSSQSSAEGFIGQIFHSFDGIWVDRCSLRLSRRRRFDLELENKGWLQEYLITKHMEP